MDVIILLMKRANNILLIVDVYMHTLILSSVRGVKFSQVDEEEEINLMKIYHIVENL